MILNKLFFIIYIIFSLDVFANYIDQKTLCNRENGVWRIFNHSCYDNCEKESDQNTPCYKILKYNCDCGKDRCWQKNKCVEKKLILKKKYTTFDERKVKKLVPKSQKPTINQPIINESITINKTKKKSSFFDYLTDFNDKVDKKLNNDNDECRNSGGKIAEFRNSCADNCDTNIKSFCAQVITTSCDCGPIKCWNGNKCIIQ